MDETLAVLREAGFDDIPYPWSHEAALNVPEHGPYADFVGWERWMSDQCEASDDLSFMWDEIEIVERAHLYSIMAFACRQSLESLLETRAGDRHGTGGPLPNNCDSKAQKEESRDV